MSPKEQKKLASASEVMRVYARYVLKYPWLFAAIAFLALALQGVSLASPVFLSRFFNTLSISSPGQAAVAALLGILSVIVLLWFVDWASRRLQDVANIFLAAKVMKQLYSDAFEYLMGHSYNFFISNFAGTLTHRVSRYARSYEVIFDMLLLQFVPAFLFVTGASFLLFLRNHWLGAALLVWSILFVAFQLYVSKLRQPVRKERAEADTKVTATLADAISNQATVIQFSGVQYERNQFNRVVSVWRKATLKAWFYDSATWGGVGLLVIAIQAGLFYTGIQLWEKNLLSLGDFVLIQSFLLGTFNSLMGISYQLRRFYDAFADAGEMIYDLELAHEVVDTPNARALTVTQGAIEFSDVTFRFGDRTVLEKYSLNIAGGEKIALVGPSGAGKSTVTKLLLRLYDVKEGEITIDGQNIASVTQTSLRDAIAFVPQEPVLFHRTLMENIRYGKLDATDEEVIAAAKKANCHDFISQLQDGYGTYVGERGIKLSGGERQRVAIARAILKDAPILILDEATSSLDSESEALIQSALEVLMRGKTVLVIAHRLSTIMKMDRIVVMQDGAVVAAGSHNELLVQDGMYKKLWSIQAGGFIRSDDEDSGELAPEPEEEQSHETGEKAVQA